jgi:hypothetical protein
MPHLKKQSPVALCRLLKRLLMTDKGRKKRWRQ